MPAMDYSKLLGRMREMRMTQESLARAIGISRQHLNNKLGGHSPFKQKDIKRICELLEIPLEDVGVYFFDDGVTKTKRKGG